MQKEVSILLDKMGIDYTNSSFFDSLKLEKVVVEEKVQNLVEVNISVLGNYESQSLSEIEEDV